MDTEIQNALSSILNVEGISGAMAMNHDSSILGALMPNLYTEENLNEVSELTVHMYDTMKAIKIRPDELVFDYHGMQLFIKDLRGKGLLLVMNESDVSSSFLDIATNMARKKIVNFLNKKNKKVKAINSTTKAFTSSTNSGYAYQNSGVSQSENFDIELSDEMTVFNKLLSSLLSSAKNEFPGSEEDFLEKVKSIVKEFIQNPVLKAEFNDWFNEKGNKIIISHVSKEEMHKIIHPLYVFLCEYHGPIEGEMLMNMAISSTSNIPQSKRFSPRNLL